MPDYIYLLESRLSADQRNALAHVREAAREAGSILFLTGDAVRDLSSGHAVRDLEIAVHGNALKLKKTIERLGGKVWGESDFSHSLYLCFPGTVRVDLITTHRIDYSKPGKPVFHAATIQDDLRRRDFTVNAMAISLNEGSFGLLMDPLNGAADIEARTLRLVSNYGFLEDPSLMIRATRYRARLGWELDPRTQMRYDNARAEGVIEHLTAQARSQELEQIGHEEDGLNVLRALEAEGWMQVLFQPWIAAKADEEKLKTLHELAVDLLLQGVHADMSAAQMQLLTAKMAPKDLSALKKLMLRPGFTEEWDSLDSLATGFAKALLAKENATPSSGFKLFTTYDPEAILWLGFTSKNAAVLERFNLFLKAWPEARLRIPHALMQEMRITPELAAYGQIVQAVFLELIDGRLTTPEEMRAYLEPHSPPAPPPQVTIKRPRAKRGAEAKIKEQSYDDDEDSDDELADDEDLDDIGGDDDDIDLGLSLPKVDLDADMADDGEPDDDDLDAEASEHIPEPPKSKAKKSAQPEPAKIAKTPASTPEKPVKTEKPQPASKPEPKAKPAAAATKPSLAPSKAKAQAPPAKHKAEPVHAEAKGTKAAKPNVKATAKAPAKPPVKAPVKPLHKAPVKAVAKGKPAPVSSAKLAHGAKPSKPPEKKPAPKPAKKR